VAAFLPLMFLPGIIGKFLRVIPLTVSVALLVSTLEALIFLPSHFAEWSSSLRNKEGARFARFQEKFSQFLSWVYQRKGWALSILLVGAFLSFSLVPFLRQDLFSAEDITVYYIDIEMPVGTPISRTNEVVREFEARLLPLKDNGEVVSINSYIGFNATGSSNLAQGNLAQIIVDITEAKEGRTRPIITLLQEGQELTKDISGPESVRFRKAQSGPPTEPPITYRLQGDNYQDLRQISLMLQEKLQSFSEVYNIQDDVEPGSPEIQVRVNPELASLFGLTAAEVGLYLRNAYEGQRVSNIFRDNREVEVLLRLSAQERRDPLAFFNMPIPTRDGRRIEFSSIAQVGTQESVASIKRVEGKREVTLSAETLEGAKLSEINREAEDYFRTQISPRYPGVEFFVGGEFAEFRNLIFQILTTLLIGLFLIYTVLGAQFKSYFQPFLILATIPFAFVGVFVFLFVSGTPFSTTVMYAAVALAGIAVNDSIVLISFINELRAEGKNLDEAILEAAQTRLRPILLTSVTTIAGLIPTALGIGGVSVVWGPMASTIIFGLIFSTLTALVIIPCLYGAFAGWAQKRFPQKELTHENI